MKQSFQGFQETQATAVHILFLLSLRLLDLGTTPTVGNVVHIGGETVDLKLTRPVCAEEASRIAISRKIMGRWRLIGYGVIK